MFRHDLSPRWLINTLGTQMMTLWWAVDDGFVAGRDGERLLWATVLEELAADGHGEGGMGRQTGAVGPGTVLAVVCAAVRVIVTTAPRYTSPAPAMTEDLRPSSVAPCWIIAIYPLAVPSIASGALGDRFGRKLMVLGGLLVFRLSQRSSPSWPATLLIAPRAAMGVGGALILPASTSIVRRVFEDRNERWTAVGIWSATLVGGAATGPLIGGFLVEHWW